MYAIDTHIISSVTNHVYRFWNIWIFHFVMLLTNKRGNAKGITSFKVAVRTMPESEAPDGSDMSAILRKVKRKIT